MKRWRIVALVSLMLAVAWFPPLPTEAATLGRPVRVGLFYGSTAMHEVRMASADGLILAYLPTGAATPLALYSQEGQASWAVRQDAFRLQFGPYGSLTSANSALAVLKGSDIRFVVSELGKYYVRFGAFASSSAAEQVLKLMPSQPGTVIGPHRVNSQSLADLSSAKTLQDNVIASGLSATLAWTANGWQVLVGHETSAAAVETLRGQLSAAQSTEIWSVSSPDLERSEVYTVDGELLLSVPSMDLYVGAIGSERTELGTPPLTTLYNGSTSKRYRGFVELTMQSNSLYRVVLYLTMDQYLMGVLPGEVYTSWPLDALKTQAIVARNWSESNRGKHGSAGFDFCTTTNCQAYVDFSGEKESTQRAVLETTGMVLTYNGNLAATYYHSDSGGYTESVENVWGGSSSPWLVSVPELYPTGSSYQHWEKRFSGAELSALLKENGVNISTVVSVQATGYSPAGRVMGLRLTDNAGKTVTLTGESPLRLYYDLSSRLYTIQPDIPPVRALGSDGQVVKLNPTGLKVATAVGTSTLARTDHYRLQGATAAVSSSAAASGFVFSGSGNGHGVGLSQWGAYAMAKNGYNYEEILKHYFQGTEILQLGE